jgi:hypothetical protein
MRGASDTLAGRFSGWQAPEREADPTATKSLDAAVKPAAGIH